MVGITPNPFLATLEIGHLLDKVGRRKRREIGRFIVTGAGRQMTGAAREGFGAVRNDWWHRRMHVGIPIRRIRQIVNLFACVRLGAAGRRLGIALVCQRQRLDLVGHWKRPIRAFDPIGNGRNEAHEQYPGTYR
jgi:hypothetical protein